MNNTKRLDWLATAVLSCGLLFSSIALAQEGHSCEKPPAKPKIFQSLTELEKFTQQHDAYKLCIHTFIEQQQAQVEQHHQAANNAIREWNRYVQTELN